MTKLSKEEIRALVKEVLKENWLTILGGKPDEKKLKYHLYDNLDTWENDMVDTNNIYSGPNLTYYHEMRRGKPIPYMTGSRDMLEVAMKWNEALAEEYDIPSSEVLESNKIMSDHYYRTNPESILGAFAA